MNGLATSGECLIEDFKLEYQIECLEFVRQKSLSIIAVCYNPYNKHDRESVLKFSTHNFTSSDKRLEIALLMVQSLIAKLELNESKVHKLSVRNGKVYYLADA